MGNFDDKSGGESESGDTLFCSDLPTSPRRDIGTILVTGAFGYIGGRLVPELVARGYRVRVMTRAPRGARGKMRPGAEQIVADALDKESLLRALDGIDTAYYLIHSMLLGPDEFAEADARAARNFREAANEKGIKRIIYLGGLGDVGSDLSHHLRSRLEVARELESGSVPVTILRAAIIIGSGSASYEIVKNLVVKLPVIYVPEWVENRIQPISIRDTIKYLVGALEVPETAGKTFDIGGSEVMTYRRMMETVVEVLGRKRFFVKVPIGNIRVFAYLTSLLTPVPNHITSCLLEGLKNEVVCREGSIRNFVPFETISLRTALVRALTREEQDRVHTRWSDSYPPAHELAMKLEEVKGKPMRRSSYSLRTSKEAPALFASMCRIGGREGWFHGNWMWRMRGEFDRVIMGVGTHRGRRHSGALEINDVIDFWRVEDIRPGRRLLLRAEMKLPGKAWLEFNIDPGDPGSGTRKLSITAHYQTATFFGRVYWLIFMPFHTVIFRGLIKQIEERSADMPNI